jgi:hypothetical protein
MTRAKRTKPQPQADLDKIWRLIGRQRTAMLITRAEDRLLDTRPMACLQPDFDGRLCRSMSPSAAEPAWELWREASDLVSVRPR